jgi:hypothetical protein
MIINLNTCVVQPSRGAYKAPAKIFDGSADLFDHVRVLSVSFHVTSSDETPSTLTTLREASIATFHSFRGMKRFKLLVAATWRSVNFRLLNDDSIAIIITDKRF